MAWCSLPGSFSKYCAAYTMSSVRPSRARLTSLSVKPFSWTARLRLTIKQSSTGPNNTKQDTECKPITETDLTDLTHSFSTHERSRKHWKFFLLVLYLWETMSYMYCVYQVVYNKKQAIIFHNFVTSLTKHTLRKVWNNRTLMQT